MEKVTMGTKPPLRMDNSSLNTSLFSFDLPALIENMKYSHSWAKGERNTTREETVFLLTIANGILKPAEN
jgi:hypothetical protein